MYAGLLITVYLGQKTIYPVWTVLQHSNTARPTPTLHINARIPKCHPAKMTGSSPETMLSLLVQNTRDMFIIN